MEYTLGVMDARLRERLERQLEKEDLRETAWVLTLDEYDEPPLFTRFHEMEFLREAPEPARGPAILQFAVEYLDRINEILVAQNDRARFACVTMTAWEHVATGEIPVALPAWLLVPDAEREFAGFQVSPPTSPEALAVQRWLVELGRDGDLVVARSESAEDHVETVYVGYRTTGTRFAKPLSTYIVQPAATE